MRPRYYSSAHCVWAALLAWVALTASAVAADDAGPEAKLSAAEREFLELLESRTFAYFWETADPATGLAPDRWPEVRSSSTPSTGFALTAYCVGVERGYITREQAVDRVRTVLRFFSNSPQNNEPEKSTGFRGFYYHFLESKTGLRYRTRELSSIDTALLMAGALVCQEYFDRDEPREQEIRELSDALYRRVEWNWMQPRAPLICMSWQPESGFGAFDYRGYNETMVLYLLALGSPTHPIDSSAWEAYTSTYEWAEFYDQFQVNFTPLFGHQFSHVWIDFHDIQDPYMRDKQIDYFENSRRATYSQRAYAIENPSGWRGYGADLWGLTSCDGPGNKDLHYAGEERRFHSYWPRGASVRGIRDDGTIAPTAAAGSIPFAPEITVPALCSMRDKYGDRLFTTYGFLDSFNPSFTFSEEQLTHGQVFSDVGWINTYHLSISQGPIVPMIENYRSGLIWKLMKKNPYVRRGLQRAGFSGGWFDERP